VVNTHAIFFLMTVGILFTALVGIAAYYYVRSRQTSQGSWEQILTRLTVVDRDSVARIALDLVDESGQRRKDDGSSLLEPSQIWKLIDGLEGLEALEKNCTVLIDLASYVQRWYPEALVVAEDLRLSAREIEWHVSRLRGAVQSGKLESSFSSYAQPAIATYYLMTRRLLALYESGNLPMLADLQRAI
jgi:hypothetical protein